MLVLVPMPIPSSLLWMVYTIKSLFYSVIYSCVIDELEQKIFDVNLTAVIKGTKVALLHMAKRGGGSIVHMASMAGLISLPYIYTFILSNSVYSYVYIERLPVTMHQSMQL